MKKDNKVVCSFRMDPAIRKELKKIVVEDDFNNFSDLFIFFIDNYKKSREEVKR